MLQVPAPLSTPPRAVTPPPTNLVLRGPTITPQMRRVAIAAYFLDAMDAPPENHDSKTAAWISNELNIPRGSTKSILKVIGDARRCAKDGVKYEDEKKHPPPAQCLLPSRWTRPRRASSPRRWRTGTASGEHTQT